MIIDKDNNNNDDIRNQKEFEQSVTPFKMFDEEIGKNVECLIGICPVCNDSIKSLIIFDEYNFMCIRCQTYEARSKYMQTLVENIKKESEKLMRFPDEQMPELIRDMKEKRPEEIDMIRSIIYDGSPKTADLLNDMRLTKSYRALPKSMSDEDRLILMFNRIREHSSFGYKSSYYNPAGLFEELHKFVKSGRI